MKTRYLLVAFLLISLLSPASILNGQDQKQNYGKAPDEIFPYQKYVKAYKYHFLEPIQFYGAGRELHAPSDLKEVRIGFLGPLSGSVMVTSGKTNVAGCHACNGRGQ